MAGIVTIQCGGERHVQQLVDGRLDWEAVKEAFLAEVVELEASGNPPLHRTGDCTGLTRQRFQANEVIKVHVTKKGAPAVQDPYALVLKKLEAAQADTSEHERVEILEDVIDRAVDMYGQRLWSGSNAHTLDLYVRVFRLPSDNTRTRIKDQQGLVFDGAFYHQTCRATLLVCFSRGTKPHLLKFAGSDPATEREAGLHERVHDIPGVLGPVELRRFGWGSRLMVTQDMVAQGVKAGCGILMPMMSASLDQVSQPLPELDVLLRAPPIQAALHAIHERNILHNDLKPANILIAPDGAWKVGDFGAATSGGEPEERTDPMWPPQMSASPRTDRIMLASTLLLVMHHRAWRDAPDVGSLRVAARKIGNQALRDFVLQLLQ